MNNTKLELDLILNIDLRFCLSLKTLLIMDESRTGLFSRLFPINQQLMTSQNLHFLDRNLNYE